MVIKSGIFPNTLKISRIIPIKKSTEQILDPANYRPVNLISPISKIIEKIWAKQINEYMKVNNMIDQNHQGGLKGRSSITATLEIFQKLSNIKMKKTDRGNYNT